MLTSKQLIKWTCDFCGRDHVQVDSNVYEGCDGQRPALPDGWIRIGRLTFCTDHRVRLLVDGT